MKGLVLSAEWAPKTGYVVSDFERRTGKAVTGNAIWRYPKLEVRSVETPQPKPDEVLIKVKACGVCGSDMHFYETDDAGLHPLSRPDQVPVHHRPRVLRPGRRSRQGGHRPEGGRHGHRRRDDLVRPLHPLPQRLPQPVPNLEEIGFTIDGAFAEYLAVGAKYCWKLERAHGALPDEDKVYEAGRHWSSRPAWPTTASSTAPAASSRAATWSSSARGPSAWRPSACARRRARPRSSPSRSRRRARELAAKVGADYVFDPEQRSRRTR